MSRPLANCLLLAAIVNIALALQGTYDHSLNIWTNGNWTVHWTVAGDEIYIGLEVGTLGWIGFAIGEETSGSMGGGDIMVAWVDSNGVGHIEDRHALGKFTPILDECHDWDLINADEDSNAGVTTIEVVRKLNTGDPQDREIRRPTAAQLAPGVPLFSRVLMAYGLTDNFSYHSSRRLSTNLAFFQTDANVAAFKRSADEEPAEKKAKKSSYYEDYRITPWEINPIRTEYICQTYFAPTESLFITSIEVLLNPATAKYVHHFGLLVNRHNDSWVRDHLENPVECFFANSPTAEWTMWGWGPGSQRLVLPEGVGFKVGAGSGVVAYTLQIHYNNPTLDEGQVDNVGVRVHYTSEQNLIPAGSLMLGDPLVEADNIPPGVPHAHYEFECIKECTQTWPHNITVFAAWFHQHQIGSQSIITYHREGADIDDYETLIRADFFDFYFQQTVPLYDFITLHPGDRINSHCYYDSSSRTEETVMAQESTDEMCVQILYYYPALPDFFLCGFGKFPEIGVLDPWTLCGTFSIYPIVNPPNPDPVGVDFREFGVDPEECPASSRVACDEQWECLSVTSDYNYATCESGMCACRPGFDGKGSADDKCNCPSGSTVEWANEEPHCLAPGQCVTGNHWMCQGSTTDYNFVLCEDNECKCRTSLGFSGTGVPSDKCRCEGTVNWVDGVPHCNA